MTKTESAIAGAVLGAVAGAMAFGGAVTFLSGFNIDALIEIVFSATFGLGLGAIFGCGVGYISG